MLYKSGSGYLIWNPLDPILAPLDYSGGMAIGLRGCVGVRGRGGSPHVYAMFSSAGAAASVLHNCQALCC